jgi:hypothetical protein
VGCTINRSVLSILLIGMAAALCWYGMSTNRLASKDLVFLKDHFRLLQPFAGAWLISGNVAYYVDLDPEAAAASYRQAVARQPSLIEAWLNLAKAELAAGHEDEAQRILKTISPRLSHVSTWKWQELILARDLRDEERFSAAFNFILAPRLPLPHRVSDASFLAKGFWGDTWAVLAHLRAESRTAFLAELMKTKESEAAFALWTTMEASDSPPDKTLRLHFCQFLLASGRVSQAKEVWATWREDDRRLTVYDGGFEQEPINQGFGWRLPKNPDVLVERSAEFPFEGKYCIYMRFLGTRNVNFSDISQVVPVEAGKVYRLSFARKSQRLTTDQGVFLEVTGYQCEGLNVRSSPVRGTTPWLKEELEVPVPAGCEAIQLRVRREESTMFDSKISGNYWLDLVELIEQNAP